MANNDDKIENLQVTVDRHDTVLWGDKTTPESKGLVTVATKTAEAVTHERHGLEALEIRIEELEKFKLKLLAASGALAIVLNIVWKLAEKWLEHGK